MGKKKVALDLSGLQRFTKLDDQEFRMTKIGSKREGSMVGVGQYEVGDFSLMEYPATKDQPEAVGAFITGRGFNYLRTSPIVKITVETPDSTTFETEGGIYKLEKYPPARPEPKECPKCKKVTNIKDMDMKMGGLLCPKCRVIIYQPYVDKEFFDERARRAREERADEAEENNSGDGQEST